MGLKSTRRIVGIAVLALLIFFGSRALDPSGDALSLHSHDEQRVQSSVSFVNKKSVSSPLSASGTGKLNHIALTPQIAEGQDKKDAVENSEAASLGDNSIETIEWKKIARIYHEHADARIRVMQHYYYAAYYGNEKMTEREGSDIFHANLGRRADLARYLEQTHRVIGTKSYFPKAKRDISDPKLFVELLSAVLELKGFPLRPTQRSQIDNAVKNYTSAWQDISTRLSPKRDPLLSFLIAELDAKLAFYVTTRAVLSPEQHSAVHSDTWNNFTDPYSPFSGIFWGIDVQVIMWVSAWDRSTLRKNLKAVLRKELKPSDSQLETIEFETDAWADSMDKPTASVVQGAFTQPPLPSNQIERIIDAGKIEVEIIRILREERSYDEDYVAYLNKYPIIIYPGILPALPDESQ